jgi:hypothetical protein
LWWPRRGPLVPASWPRRGPLAVPSGPPRGLVVARSCSPRGLVVLSSWPRRALVVASSWPPRGRLVAPVVACFSRKCNIHTARPNPTLGVTLPKALPLPQRPTQGSDRQTCKRTTFPKQPPELIFDTQSDHFLVLEKNTLEMSSWPSRGSVVPSSWPRRGPFVPTSWPRRGVLLPKM